MLGVNRADFFRQILFIFKTKQMFWCYSVVEFGGLVPVHAVCKGQVCVADMNGSLGRVGGGPADFGGQQDVDA